MEDLVATRKPQQKQSLKFFKDYDDQEAKDLAYGAQKPECKKYLKKDNTFTDHSIEGDWIPDED